ncbi:secretoglobin family 1D member 2 isoform X2 [Myotis lucifugus]|uniref:secretoglobin family 1D member 2 isoform X2 n=1 Tax=Myotis lucifugus TaxID=59463 RepID=UPI0006D736EC|nr:secretoglobin family 1D member 2 isoform X2 [Myotis lucifugus]
MKLALSLLLVTLALCCSDANAEVCPALGKEVISFLLDTKARFNDKIQKFDAPQAAKQAKLQVKKCVDNLSMWDRITVAHFVERVKFECNKQHS